MRAEAGSRTDLTKLISTFRKFANAANERCSSYGDERVTVGICFANKQDSLEAASFCCMELACSHHLENSQ